MPNWNSAIKKIDVNDVVSVNVNHHSELFISEVEPIMKLNVRGKSREFISSVGKSLNILLPNEPNTSSSGANVTALWLGPDEWMIHANEKNNDDSNSYIIEDELVNKISNTGLGAITDVTDQFVMLNLTGEKIYDLFMKGSPFNFNEFQKKKGAVTQTIINKIDVIIHNKSDNEINLFVRRSFSNHLWSWLNDSARFI